MTILSSEQDIRLFSIRWQFTPLSEVELGRARVDVLCDKNLLEKKKKNHEKVKIKRKSEYTQVTSFLSYSQIGILRQIIYSKQTED